MGCGTSSPATHDDGRSRPAQTVDGFAMAEAYMDHHRSLRKADADTLNRVMLTSRVEHDSGPAVWAAASEDGTRSGTRSGTDELDSDRAARSQADALEHFNRAASLRRVSGPTAQHSNGRSSASPRSPAESAARREARRRARLQNEEEELALMLAVSASEAEAVAATMAEPIQLEDARAITAAQSELDRGLATAEAERAGAAGVRDGGGNATATAERPAGVRASRSASSAGGASFCETIPEAAGEEQSAEPQVQSLRGRYSAVETAEQDMYTEAEQAAYQKIQQHAAMQRSKFAPRDAESSNSSCGSSAPSSRFSPRSAQRRSLELIAEHAAAKTAKAQRHEQQDQEEIKPMRPWRQNSLDSAYDLHRIKAPPAQPRGFMVA